jgi:cytochrome c oxidase cbb3-type subunit 3
MVNSSGRRRAVLACGIAALLATAATSALGQAPAPAAGIFGQATFPGKQRPPGDPAVIARGQALFGINCKACHGSDLRGGDLGGPNLLRSQLVLGDRNGEAIIPVVQKGRPPAQGGGPPMPAFPLPLTDIQAIAEFIHSVVGKKQNQGGPPPEPEKPLNILVGDPQRGQKYFAAHCQKCHAADGDLKGIATRVSNPATLQDSWVAGRHAGPALPGTGPKTEVRVTLNDGSIVRGTLKRVDDFNVSLVTAQGQYRSFARQGAQGARSVALNDPLQWHRQMLPQYTDQDVHDVTAYLASLK